MGIRDIKLLLTDVDGVLTDGKVLVGAKDEYVGFDIQDGIGHRLAAYGGLTVGWLSGRLSQPVAVRAKKLKVHFLYQGKLDKRSVAEGLARQRGLKMSEIAYIGDDLIDLPLLSEVGWSATVPYGRPELKRSVDYVTKAQGGGGAFREIVEKVLKAQGLWDRTIREFHRRNKALARRDRKGLD